MNCCVSNREATIVYTNPYVSVLYSFQGQKQVMQGLKSLIDVDIMGEKIKHI